MCIVRAEARHNALRGCSVMGNTEKTAQSAEKLVSQKVNKQRVRIHDPTGREGNWVHFSVRSPSAQEAVGHVNPMNSFLLQVPNETESKEMLCRDKHGLLSVFELLALTEQIQANDVC